jgi:hypothetical protein
LSEKSGLRNKRCIHMAQNNHKLTTSDDLARTINEGFKSTASKEDMKAMEDRLTTRLDRTNTSCWPSRRCQSQSARSLATHLVGTMSRLTDAGVLSHERVLHLDKKRGEDTIFTSDGSAGATSRCGGNRDAQTSERSAAMVTPPGFDLRHQAGLT